MNIREMKLDDYVHVDALMQKLHKIHVNGRPDIYIDMEHPYSLDDYTKMLNDENTISILAEEDNKIVGICFVAMRTRSMMVDMNTAYMDDLIVDENFRGRGIAKALFQKAEEEARNKGAKRLDLMVWAFNESAINFYEEIGMKPQRYILEKPL